MKFALSLFLLFGVSGKLLAQERVIPNNRETVYTLKSGYDSDRDVLKGKCVNGDVTAEGTPSANVKFTQQLSRSKLVDDLHTGVSASVHPGSGMTFSSAVDFVSRSVSDNYTISMTYGGRYQFKNTVLTNQDDEKNQTELFKKLKTEPLRFRDTCGDEFVLQIGKGAQLYFNISISFSSKEEKEKFAESFDFNSSFASAHQELQKSRESFSSHTKVEISVLQIGGEVEKISSIFSGTPTTQNSTLQFVQCTFGDFSKCDQVLAHALDYATNTQTGFPGQLKGTDDGIYKLAANLFYITQSYATLGVILPPSILVDAVQKNRELLAEYYKKFSQPLDEANSILSGVVPLSARQKSALLKERDKLQGNVDQILEAAQICIGKPEKCIDSVKNLNLAEPDPSALVINPETFQQWCKLKDSTVISDSAKTSIAGYIEAVKKLDPARFQSAGQSFGIHECDAAELVLRHADRLDISKLNITTLEPIAEFNNLKSLTANDNAVEDLTPLSNFNNLRSLKLSHNHIQDVSVLSKLANLTELDISSNHIFDISSLTALPNLERIDARGNIGITTCPNFSKSTRCQVSNPNVLVEFHPNFYFSASANGPNDYSQCVARLPDGNYLISGVRDMSTPAENHGSAFIFHPDTARFERIEDSKLQHLETACLSLQDGRILLFGNPQFSERGITRMEVYHPESRQFEVLPIVLPGMRLLGKAVELPNNRVLYIGGVQGDIKPVKPFTFSNVTIEADIIDLNPNRQSVKIVKTNALRLANSVTRLLDGRILIAGGSGDRTAEIFDPTNDTFVPTQGFLDHPRGEHTATLLKDGRVLLTGGIDFREGYAKFDNSMEIYDPKADRFYLLKEAMRYPRASHTAQILDNGKVLLIGGKQDFGKSCENCLSNGEIFDPNTMTIDDIAGHMSAKRALVNVIPGNDHLFYVLGVVDTSNTDALDIVVYQELIPKTHMANAEK